jgi:trans-AT polyketide synthase/acyltransferase/oxidoreductase domain-containing protein
MSVVVFPGQGAQRKGMGRALFARYADLTRVAEAILGLSLPELVESAERLGKTQYTQPALFVVNALSYLEWRETAGRDPDYAAGHSLGEYNALVAAGALDFATAVRLVKLRGELMAQAEAGSMAAVIGMSSEMLTRELYVLGAGAIDLANDNSPSQQVISGPRAEIQRVIPGLRERGATVIELRVSAAFHSRYMKPARERFAGALAEVTFGRLRFPVISNVAARPYEQARIGELLAQQIDSPVRWTDSIRYLIARGEDAFEELGPGRTLTKLVAEIREHASRHPAPQRPEQPGSREARAEPSRHVDHAPQIRAEELGSAEFREAYGVRFSYAAGAMYKGIASKELVIRMGRAGLLSFLGTGGLKLERIESDLRVIQAELRAGQPYGVNLLSNFDRPEMEERIVDIYLRLGVRNVEAAAYVQPTRALVRFRVSNLFRGANGEVIAPNRVMAKVSRPEVARVFMSPPPASLLDALLADGAITDEQAVLAREIPLACDICVEADSGGHTDRGVLGVLLPAMRDLRDELAAEGLYRDRIRVGAAGGIGTPEAAACAFLMGADFVVTGSINQCTVEAGTSDAVKDILETLDVQDTTYAPAGDMFEIGAIVQVVRKGVLFAAKGNRLYALYQQFESWSDIDEPTRRRIEEKFFRRSFDEVWAETRGYYEGVDPAVVHHAERSPKKKMALVFRWYFIHTARLSMRGEPGQKTDYQIHCGPALGAFNRWVRGTARESWRSRHVDDIALLVMEGTAKLLLQRLEALTRPQVKAGPADRSAHVS